MANDKVFGSLLDQNNGVKGQKYNPRQQGVFGLNPLATPKYAKNKGLRDAEFRDTLARLYISVGDMGTDAVNAYLNALPTDQDKALGAVLLGATARGGTGFIDFFLTQANEQFQEIVQIDKVLADDYVAFFFGQQPAQFQYSGMLLNSLQDDQRSGFARAYNLMLRGTQLARKGALARIRYDSVIVSGTMIAHQQTLNADNEMAVPFSFTFLVKEYVVITSLPFAKMSVNDYVKLAADAAVASLQPVGVVQDTRVRTSANPPPLQADLSTAGGQENLSVIDTSLNPMQQTIFSAQSTFDALHPNSVFSNVKGTIDPNPPTPPSAP